MHFSDPAPHSPVTKPRCRGVLQALAEEDDDRPAAKMQKVAPPQQKYRGPLAHQVPPLLSVTGPERPAVPASTHHLCTDQPERGGRAAPTRRRPAALDRPHRRRPARACDGLPVRLGPVHPDHRQDGEEHGPPVLQVPRARRRLQLLQMVRRGAACGRRPAPPQQPCTVLWRRRWLRQRAGQRLWRQCCLRC